MKNLAKLFVCGLKIDIHTTSRHRAVDVIASVSMDEIVAELSAHATDQQRSAAYLEAKTRRSSRIV